MGAVRLLLLLPEELQRRHANDGAHQPLQQFRPRARHLSFQLGLCGGAVYRRRAQRPFRRALGGQRGWIFFGRLHRRDGVHFGLSCDPPIADRQWVGPRLRLVGVPQGSGRVVREERTRNRDGMVGYELCLGRVSRDGICDLRRYADIRGPRHGLAPRLPVSRSHPSRWGGLVRNTDARQPAGRVASRLGRTRQPREPRKSGFWPACISS
jgi:hypothetical protein